jgi:serine/threonine protein kinase
MPAQPGQMLSHYRLVEKIGEGGMGVVWKALDTKLDREVALKILPEEMAGDPERYGRFEREAKAVAALDHPNIVTIHSVEEDEGVHFITMGLVRGKSLTELIPGTACLSASSSSIPPPWPTPSARRTSGESPTATSSRTTS